MRKHILVLSLAVILSACGNQNADQTAKNEPTEPLKRKEIINPVPELKRQTIEEDLENHKDIQEEVLRDQLEEGVSVFKQLETVKIDSISEDSPQMYTTINFLKDGKFNGEYFATKSGDGYDAGLADAAKKVGTDEIHVSSFDGEFQYIEQVGDRSYKLKLKNLYITSKEGVDSKMPQKATVDFTKQLNVDDEYILFLDGAPIPLETRKGTALENQINPMNGPEKEKASPDRAYGPILYSPSEDIVWKTWVY
ncbi:hypothetical protein [uncultured Anaerococcus sp.]|uniref:hypothetical protein n=1 Tax=Anaerococcus sp. AH8042_DFU013_CI05 TaxID=3385202 RepID=UPI0025F56472|nr:hypothetical protein [uncultured Anaerococcus sp.]